MMSLNTVAGLCSSIPVVLSGCKYKYFCCCRVWLDEMSIRPLLAKTRGKRKTRKKPLGEAVIRTITFVGAVDVFVSRSGTTPVCMWLHFCTD